MKEKESLLPSCPVEGDVVRSNVKEAEKSAVNMDVQMISLNELHDFKGHPFKVETDIINEEY